MQIPDYFKFYNKTRIISGKKSMENIPFDLKSMDAVKPLIITDKKSVREGLVKLLISAYGDSGLVIGAAFDRVSEYASIKTVIDAAELFRARGCDSVIAVGGENASFIARGVNLLVSHRKKTLLDFDKFPEIMHLRPFVMIPSFDASGRETGDRAVIDGRTYKSQELMPDIVIIDSRMLKKGDMSKLSASALSALAEAVEACTAEKSNPIIDSFAFSSIQLICENLPAVFKNGYSGKYKLGLANGIAISGIVNSNTPDGALHALAVELSKATGYSRELFSGLLLPYILDYRLNNSKKGVRGELLLPASGIDVYCSVSENERSSRGVEEIFKIVQSAGKYMPSALKELKIPLYVLDKIAAELEQEYASAFGKGGVLKILESAYEGTLLSGGSR